MSPNGTLVREGPRTSHAIDIEVLGPLKVSMGGESLVPTAPKPRQVLATLSAHADETVPVATLYRELWGDELPHSARNTLQTHVLHLREHIGDVLKRLGDHRSPKEVLATLPGGYHLFTGVGALDTREFEQTAVAGYRAIAERDALDGSRLLGNALAVWRGPAFADVQCGAILTMESRRLDEARLCAVEEHIAAQLHLGRHREVISQLTVLTNDHPTHETLHLQLMQALSSSGRRGEALLTYQRLRTVLARVGLEPSHALQQSHGAILGGCNGDAGRAPALLVGAVD